MGWALDSLKIKIKINMKCRAKNELETIYKCSDTYISLVFIFWFLLYLMCTLMCVGGGVYLIELAWFGEREHE